MRNPSQYPSVRPLGITPDAIESELDTTGVESSTSVTNIPWVDIHQHTQTLSWNDQHQFSISGCRAVVMIAANYHWSPYRPVTPEDVRFLWDLAIKWDDYLNKKHPFETYTSIGIHTVAKVDDWDSLIEVLPDYCSLDEVIAIGETGIEPVQYASRWPVAEQRTVVRDQMHVAHETGLPIIIHTPTKKSVGEASAERGWGGLGLSEPDPTFSYDEPKREAIEIDLELLDETALADDRVVIDHGDPTIVEYVMENTDCYLGFSVSSPLKGVTTEDIAQAIETYGPDRIIIDSDMMGYRECDLLCIPRTILDLHSMGIQIQDLRKVVYENPLEILGLTKS